MKLRIHLAAPLLALFVVAPVVQSQETKQSYRRERLIAAAREIIATSRYAALITLDASGHTQARTVDPFAPDQDFVIWIGTNPRTRKVAEIRRNPRVSLYYFDREAQAYVTIRGVARLVNDAEAKKKWFKDEWKGFYPDRVNDFTLIKVTTERLEVVSVIKGILGDSVRWLPPSVRFPKIK